MTADVANLATEVIKLNFSNIVIVNMPAIEVHSGFHYNPTAT